MRALRDAGIHTPAPLADVDGELVQTVSVDAVRGPRHYDVLRSRARTSAPRTVSRRTVFSSVDRPAPAG